MKQRKNLSTGILLALTILIALGAAWSPAAAAHLKLYRLVEGGTIALGKQGIAVTKVPTGVTHALAGVSGEPLPPRFEHNGQLEYRSPVLEVRFLNGNGGTVADIFAPVYVFFNIGKAEKALWDQQGTYGISIWYIDDDMGSWTQCPTMFVNENRDNGMFDRLACIAPGGGYFVLGHVEFDELLFNPYTFDNQKVVDFRLAFGPQ
jgi:hypothetical protein